MKARVLTALALIPVAMGAVLNTSPLLLFALLALLVGLGATELWRLREGIRKAPWPLLAPVVLVSYWFALSQRLAPRDAGLHLLALTLVGALCAPLWVRRGRWLLFETGSLWVAAPLAAVGVLHMALAPTGRAWDPRTPLLLLALPLWAGDTLAYFVGRRFGRRPLAPRISPNKTAVGGLANLAGCVLVAGLLASWTRVPLGVALGCGAIAGVAGQAGDLLESWLKRASGVKDSGAVLPGHGGVLDRIDSLLLAAPLQVVLLLAAVGPQR